MSARISLVEDTDDLRKMLSQTLSDAGYNVRHYRRAQDFERDLDEWNPDLSIVDLGLPDKDGMGLLSDISTKKDTAILVISGRSSITDKIAGLELGADDYLTKPFEVSELLARVRALLRRAGPKTDEKSETTTYKFCGWTLDLDQFMLIDKDGEHTRLSASEAALMRVFLKRSNRLITRDQLREELGDRSDEFSFDRAIDVRVSRLRAKLRDSTKEPKIIKTIYGAGYILISDVE